MEDDGQRAGKPDRDHGFGMVALGRAGGVVAAATQVGVVFNEAVRLMVRAFERQVVVLHGRGVIPVAPGGPAPPASG